MSESQGHFIWFPLDAGRRVHVTKEENEAQVRWRLSPRGYLGAVAPALSPSLPSLVPLDQDSSPKPTCPHQPCDLCVCSQHGPAPEHDPFSSLSSIKEKLMTQADRFSEEEVSSGVFRVPLSTAKKLPGKHSPALLSSHPHPTRHS